MNETLEKPVAEKPPAVAITKFALPDLDRHAAWLLPRLRQAWPHLNERALIGWLRGLIYSNEFLFVTQPHAVALAQMIGSHTLSPKPIVQERFVWVEDRENKAWVNDAAAFYPRIKEWAKALGAEQVIVEEMSDVPHDLIAKAAGRVFKREQQFVRVTG